MEQSLLLPRYMVDLRSMRWHEDLLGPEGGLDGLKRMGVQFKKKKNYHCQVPLQLEENFVLPHRLEFSHVLGQ